MHPIGGVENGERAHAQTHGSDSATIQLASDGGELAWVKIGWIGYAYGGDTPMRPRG